MHPQGVVFDLDGTLLESEKLARACFMRACADVGWSADAGLYNQCVGTTYEQTERIVRAGFGPDFPFERMSERWSTHYHAHIHSHGIDIKPGIPELLTRLEALRIPMAIATSSQRTTVELKLDKAGLARFFVHSVCAGEVPAGKPAPDPYLRAVKLLDLSAPGCWAVEDSDTGTRSAVTAGLQVFQIPDELPPQGEIGQKIVRSALDLLPLLV